MPLSLIKGVIGDNIGDECDRDKSLDRAFIGVSGVYNQIIRLLPITGLSMGENVIILSTDVYVCCMDGYVSICQLLKVRNSMELLTCHMLNCIMRT